MTVPAITKYNAAELATISIPSYSVLEVSQEDIAVEFTSPSRLSQWLYVDAFLGNLWSLTIHAMTGTEVTTMKTFWENHKGRVIPFKWVNPTDGSTYYVRFSSSSLLFQRVSKTHWSCSFLISEAHPLEIEVSGV